MAKVALNTMVAAETLEAIRGMATGKSQGQVIDEAIAALRGGDKHGEVNRWFRETWTRLDEILETVQSEPSNGGGTLSTVPGTPVEAVTAPFSRDCKHCGDSFGTASKWATICPPCKSSGHTNLPAECPQCTAGASC